LRRHDRITEVNGSDTRGASHAEVVNLVIKGGGILDLVIIRVNEEEADRLQRIEDSGNAKNKKKVRFVGCGSWQWFHGASSQCPTNGLFDPTRLSFHRPHPPVQASNASAALVSIRDYHSLEQAKGSYTVFNIYVRGEYCTSRRYSELANFYKRLKARFPWNKFPPFPGKKMNGLMSSTLGVSASSWQRRAAPWWYRTVVVLNRSMCFPFVSDSVAAPSVQPRELEARRQALEEFLLNGTLQKRQCRPLPSVSATSSPPPHPRPYNLTHDIHQLSRLRTFLRANSSSTFSNQQTTARPTRRQRKKVCQFCTGCPVSQTLDRLVTAVPPFFSFYAAKGSDNDTAIAAAAPSASGASSSMTKTAEARKAKAPAERPPSAGNNASHDASEATTPRGKQGLVCPAAFRSCAYPPTHRRLICNALLGLRCSLPHHSRTHPSLIV
jgi:hypothetical protein